MGDSRQSMVGIMRAAKSVKKIRTTIPGLRYRLKAAREATTMTQSEVARRLECSRSSVSQWEDGTNEPHAQRLRELARLYSVTHEWLAHGDEDVIRDVVRIALEDIEDEEQRS